MIYDDIQEWSICTPPKSGTHTLEHLLRPYARITRPRHAMTKWKGHRIMPVRYPMRRWLSMWRFLRNTGYWLPRQCEQGLHAFAAEWVRRRDHVHWAPNLTEFAAKYDPHSIHIIEEGGIQGILDELTEKFQIPATAAKVLNSTKSGEEEFIADLELLKTSPDYQFIVDWCQEDCDTFKVRML